MKIYLRAIGRHPLLSRLDEQRLSRDLRSGREAAAALAHTRVAGGAGIPARHRRQLEAAVATAEVAERELTEANLRLVVSIAKRYRQRSMPLLDLIQEGNLGLMEAAKRFDHERGSRFSTYATRWINQAIMRGLATKSRVVRLPVPVAHNLALVRQAECCRITTGGEPPSIEQLAAETGLSCAQVEQARRQPGDTVSLSALLADGEELCLYDVIDDPATARMDEPLSSFLPSAVRHLLCGLNEREQDIVRLRFGLDEEEPLTLDQVGRRYHITRERVRQIENNAIAKLLGPAGRAGVGLDALPG